MVMLPVSKTTPLPSWLTRSPVLVTLDIPTKAPLPRVNGHPVPRLNDDR